MPKRKTLIIMFCIVVLFVLAILVLRQIIIYNQQQAEFENKVYDVLDDFETVQEVAKYLDCEYIKEIDSPNETFKKDIYVKFKHDLYTEGASNQEYYYSAAILFAQVTQYQNIRLIDDSRELLIAILGDSEKEVITKLYINGKENYYGEQDTIQALENYKTSNVSRIEIQAQILKDLINNNWDVRDIDFGTQESNYDGYEVYFDEGIEIKKVGTKIFNIVFTDKYKEAIVNDITVNADISEVSNILGTPIFGKIEMGMLGYKGEKLYIFFEKNRISVYPVDKNEREQDLLRLMEEFRQSRDVKKFINSITDIWPEYDKYEYDEEYVDLEYTLKGIKFQFNVGRDNGIIFYNNYNGSYINDLRQNKNELPLYTYFVDENLIYQNERSNTRNIHNHEFIKSDYEYMKNTNGVTDRKYSNDSSKFFIAPGWSKNYLRIVSVEGDYPVIEIKETANSYFWINDITLAYSIKNKGIYKYNVETQEQTPIVEGEDEFKISNYQNGFLYYDDKYLIYELADAGMDTYVWLDSNTIIYSIKNKGIYTYNIITQEQKTVLEGTEEFNITKYENGRLYYDSNVYYFVD